MARKKILVDRQRRVNGVLQVLEDLGDQSRVRFADGTELTIPNDDIRNAVNSHDLLVKGDHYVSLDRNAVGLCRKGYDLSKLTPQPLRTGHALELRKAALFKTWEDMVEWAKANGRPYQWGRDPFGGWVPLGSKYCISTQAEAPCMEFVVTQSRGSWGHTCGRPRVEGSELCKLHSTASEKRAARWEAWNQNWNQKQEDDRRKAESDRSSADWAARIVQEFGVRTSPTLNGSGNVQISPEGLYSLLAAAAKDAPWLLEDLPPELVIRPESPDQD